MTQKVMYNELVAHSCYADTSELKDENLYTVKHEYEGKYQLYGKSGEFKCEWFCPVYYSTEIPSQGKKLLITDYEDEMNIIIPRIVVNTETYNNLYKVYSKEREDFYVVLR